MRADNGVGKASEAGPHNTEAGAWCFVMEGCSGCYPMQCQSQVRGVWLVRPFAHPL